MDKNLFLKVIVLTVIFGLGAGLVGQLIATAYFIPGEIFVLGAGRVGGTTNQTSENEKILEAERSVAPAILGIFPQKSVSHDPLNQIYLPGERTASGVALTSDGWLLSYGKNLADTKNHFVVITQDQKIFVPQKTILDEATGAVFMKIETQNLPVPKLGSYENLALGEKILIPLGKQSFKTFQVSDLAYEQTNSPSDLLKSSEKLSKLILLDGEIAKNEIGTPLTNLNGEVAGLVSASSPAAAVPIDYWQSAFLNILKTEGINRAYLGVHYLELEKAPGISEALSQGKNSGALIWSSKNPVIAGVVRGSPAAASGLRDGDIILKINTDEISQRTNLSELIAEYSPEEKIQITAQRNGEEKIFEVTLGKN